jgi:ABC-type Zn uptake system ZnuABC Zn-binding protein ZnuA
MRPPIVTMLAVLACAAPARAATSVNVVTTTEDLAALAGEVGGARLKVKALTHGDKRPSTLRLAPAMMSALQQADLLIVVGSGLEDRWIPGLVSASRNARIQAGVGGYCDVSASVDLLEIPPPPPLPAWALVPPSTEPTPTASPAARPNGNPFYWLDPGNGRRIAQAIRKQLTTLDPAGASDYARRYADFDRRLAAGERRWGEALAPFRGVKLGAVDRTWSYFAARFGLEIVPAAELRRASARVLLVEPFVDLKPADALAARSGGRPLVLPSSVGGVKAASDYIGLFDEIVARLVAALR